MSDLLNELEELLSDEQSQTDYKHELALSAFTNEIARQMDEAGVNRAELARRLGVSRARVSQLLQHASSPTLRTMVEVSAALGCDVVPVVAPRGLRPSRLLVADGGKTVAAYRETRRVSSAHGDRMPQAERIAV